MTLASSSAEIRRSRRTQPHDPTTALITVAALWPKKGNNLGTLCRTLDAIQGALIVPHHALALRAVAKGNTIGRDNTPVILIDHDPVRWLELQHATGFRIVGVELAPGAVPVAELDPATGPTVVVLGHEATGIPAEAFPFFDDVVEIPMFGVGNSLNVAVAGSLVAYKLAGLI